MYVVKALPCASCQQARDARGNPILATRFVGSYRCEQCRRRYRLTPPAFAELPPVPWDDVERHPVGQTARREALAGLTEAQRGDVDAAGVGLEELLLARPA